MPKTITPEEEVRRRDKLEKVLIDTGGDVNKIHDAVEKALQGEHGGYKCQLRIYLTGAVKRKIRRGARPKLVLTP